MWNSPLLFYYCWKDAEKECKNSPPSNGNNGCFIIFCLILIFALLKASFEVGGFGIIIGIAIIIGIMQGLTDRN